MLMKKLFIELIDLYQKNPLPTHNMCRFNPSCSEYMKQAVEKYGFRGFILGIKRILRCNPLCKAGYDPVPEKLTK